MPNDDKENQNNAPGNEGQHPVTPPASSTTPAPKLEFKDGVVLVDGKKFVKESDLIAAKESLQKQNESAQQTHNSAIEKLRLEVDAAQKEVAKANAALEDAKKARESGAISAEEFAKAKADADKAKADLANESKSSMDFRRKYIMATYHIPANSDTAKGLETKTSVQLDALEEAMKAVQGARQGPGNYAFGSAGAGATPRTDRQRARELLDATPIRGVRNSTPPTK